LALKGLQEFGLFPRSCKKNIESRLHVTNPDKFSHDIHDNAAIEVYQSVLPTMQGLNEALWGIHSAYYLIPSIGLLRKLSYF